MDTSRFHTNLNGEIEEKNSFTSSTVRNNKKNIWRNTLRSLSQVRGTIYTSTE